jgi:predicted dienelactone hydrolase
MVAGMLRALFVGVALLGAATAVLGLDDACRSGASSLGDRRALAELRAVIEADCGCEAGDGVARRAFVRCARARVHQALRDGELRRACLQVATGDIRRSTCGTNRVACGQVTASDSAACRLSAPAGQFACGAARDRAETACVAQTHCSDVAEWTAGTCLDPRQRGPYGVGARVVRMTKDSAFMPGTARVLDTVVWYPSAAEGPLNAQYAAVVDAPLDRSGAPYPVLMFSHGSCGYATQSLFLTALVASYGYVVVSPPHPGNTLAEFPACGTPAAQVPSFFERPEDIIYALDQMLAANQDEASPFFAALDPQRVGMSGHSFGGLTTYLAASRDNRFAVAVPMAPAALGMPRLTIPSLAMLGQEDSVVDLPAIRAAYDASAPPKFLVEIENAGHYAFSDLCFPGPDCNPPVTLTQDEAHALALRWLLPFLEQYLAGRRSLAPFLLAPPPGATVTAVVR